MTLFLPMFLTGVNVLDFGADPTGTVDSTVAFAAARAATGRSEAIRVPGGVYLIDPNAFIDLNSRLWVGDVGQSGAPESILKASGPGGRLGQASSRTQLVNLIFDGNGLATDCVRLERAHRTLIWNVVCQNAADVGMRSDETNIATVYRLICQGNGGHGQVWIGPNGLNSYDTRAVNNGGAGIDWAGVGSPDTEFSGQMSVFGFECSGNVGPGVQIRGVTNGYLGQGEIVSNGADGIRYTDRAANILCESVRLVAESPGGAALNFVFGRLCTFLDVHAVGDPNWERALIDNASSDNRFFACTRGNGSPLPLALTDGVDTFIAEPDGQNIRIDAVPTEGTFRRGALGWRANPTIGSNRGWRVTVAGTPGTWSSF